MSAMEQALLGGLLLVPESYWQVADIVTPDDFADGRHVAMYRCMHDCATDGKPCDTVTLGELLPGLSGYAIELANGAASAANVRHYAEKVAGDSIRRQVHSAGHRIAKLEGDDVLAEALRELQSIQRRDSNAVRSSKDVLRDVVADLQRKCEADSPITGLDSGFEGINDITGGLQPADLIIIAGRPSMGKSTLAQNIAERVALRGQRVLFFSQEMSAASVLTRSIASTGSVQFGALRSPKMLDDAAWARVLSAGDRLAKCPLLLDETCGITIEQIEARARQCHASAQLSLIVIDYLQYMRLPRADTVANSVQEVTRRLKALAKTLGVPVVLLSQLNRGVESRNDKRPNMSDLRDSGAIEQDADLIVFMYRDGYYDANSPHKNYAEAIVSKQRNGRTGTVWLESHLDQMRFEDSDAPPMAANDGVATFENYANKERIPT